MSGRFGKLALDDAVSDRLREISSVANSLMGPDQFARRMGIQGSARGNMAAAHKIMQLANVAGNREMANIRTAAERLMSAYEHDDAGRVRARLGDLAGALRDAHSLNVLRSTRAFRQEARGHAGDGPMGLPVPSRAEFDKFIRGQGRARRRATKKRSASPKNPYEAVRGRGDPSYRSGWSEHDLRDLAGDVPRGKARDGGPGSGPRPGGGKKPRRFKDSSHQERWLHGAESEADKKHRTDYEKSRKSQPRGRWRQPGGLYKNLVTSVTGDDKLGDRMREISEVANKLMGPDRTAQRLGIKGSSRHNIAAAEQVARLANIPTSKEMMAVRAAAEKLATAYELDDAEKIHARRADLSRAIGQMHASHVLFATRELKRTARGRAPGEVHELT